MKKIPEKYELDQEDIEEAIIDWLNNHPTTGGDGGDDFVVKLKRETKLVPPKGGPIGGMSDPVEEYHFSAVAEKQ